MNGRVGEERRVRAVAARMDAHAAVARSMGKKVEVSEMELIAICSMANLGTLSVFSALEGDTGETASAEMEATIAAIREHFQKIGYDGLNRAVQACVAILGQDRLARYVIRPGKD